MVFIKGVVLTKDNLPKRNWNGCKRCSSCLADETIQLLFFECKHARFLWGLVQICLGLQPPQNVKHMFNEWLSGTEMMLFLIKLQ